MKRRSRPRHHRVVLLIGLGVSLYAWTRIFHQAHALDAVIWFGAAILAHDAIFLPFYRLSYGVAHRLGRVDRARHRRTPVLRHVVVPAVVSAFQLIVWIPLILRPASSGPTYSSITGVSSGGYLGRWALITAGLFAFSGVVYAIRALRAGGLPEHAGRAGLDE